MINATVFCFKPNIRNYKNIKIAIVIAAAIILLLGTRVSAEAVTIDEIRLQIIELQARIRELQVQLARMLQAQLIKGVTDFRSGAGGQLKQSTPASTSTLTYEEIYKEIPVDFIFENNLRYGSRNDEVRYLQLILKKEVGPPIYPERVPATGWFGPITRSALIHFQRKYASEGLKVTGFVDYITRNKLNQILNSIRSQCPPSPPSAPSLVAPADGDIIQSLTPTLLWNPPSSWGKGCLDDKRYRLQVADNPKFSSPFINTVLSSEDTSYSISTGQLSEDTLYYWRVRAENNRQYSSYNSRSFKVNTSEISPSPLSPKVFLLIYNPILESHGGLRLTRYMHWNDPDTLSQQFIQDISEASEGFVNYQIAERVEVDDIPIKADGFDYTDESYLQCLTDHNNCHNPDEVNYRLILNTYNICQKLNDGLIDELWLFGGPWFGYYESRLAGPDAFWYNSPPLTGTDCNKLLPIMGFNYERGVGEMLESFGHRVESTMTHVYGGWDVTQSRHAWDKFGHNRGQTPNVEYYQCGTAHYAPNSLSDYDRGNLDYVPSNCNDWYNYPSFTGLIEQINCSAWGCNTRGYLKWWLNHLPRAEGTTDGKLNNWWRYVVDYNNTIEPPEPPPLVDTDGDGCSDAHEKFYGLDPQNPWDFYDVPTPVFADPRSNGTRNQKVDADDVAAVLFYFGTQDGLSTPNGNGVSYMSVKDGDWSGSTPFEPDGIVDNNDRVGLRYDRSPGPPDPDGSGPIVDPAGPPNGSVDISDVLAVIAQKGVDCTIQLDANSPSSP